jgi:hypothetical protein
VLAGRIGKNFAKQIVGATLHHTGSVCRLDRGRACVIVLLARYIDRMDGSAQWYVHWDQLEAATIAVIGLLDPGNAKVSSYYVVNDPDLAGLQLRKSRDDGRCLHQFAQTDLSGCIKQVAVHTATMR